jgi:TP901 family phage tail tape measure protein
VAEKLIIEIDLDDKKLTKGVSKALKSLKQSAQKEGGEAANILKRSFSGVSKELSNIRRNFAGLFTGLAVAGAIRELAQFEKQLVAVGKTTNFTDKQLKTFGRTILNMSKRIPLATDELLKISEVAGQLGINDAKQLAKFTETIAKLSVSISGLSPEDAAIELARLIELTKGSLNDVDKLGSSLVALGNTFKVNEGQIISVASEVSKVAGIYGVSAQSVLGFSAALAQAGVPAEQARTTFLTLFDTIGAAVSTNGKELVSFANQTGLTVKEFKNLARTDPTKTILKLAESFKGLQGDGIAINKRLKELGINEKRVRTGFSALIATSDSLRGALNLSSSAFEKNTALNEEAERAFNTLSRQFTRFGNVLKAIGIELSGNLTKNLGKLFKGINDLLAADGVAKKIQNLAKSLAGTAAILAVMVGAGTVVKFLKSVINMGRAAVLTARGYGTLRGNMIAYTGSVSLADKATRIFTKTMKIAKAVATLGLAFALDLIIEKFIELANLSPLQKVNKEIESQTALLQKLNAERERGTRIEQGVRGTAKFVVISDEEKAKLDADIASVKNAITQLNTEKDKLSKKPDGADGEDGLAAYLKRLAAEAKKAKDALEGVKFNPDPIKLTFDSVLGDFKKTAAGIAVTSKQISLSLINGMAKGASSAFSSVGKAIADGENAFDALAASVLSSIGSMITQMGESFILQGIAHSVNPLTPGLGGPLIAAGLAMTVFGGFLGGVAGRGRGTSADEPKTSGPDDIDQPVAFEPDELEEKGAGVVVNVEGTVLDPAAVGQQIVDVLNEAGFTNGARVIA